VSRDPFEDYLRRELHGWADQIEPVGTLAQLRNRIKLWRLRHRRPPRLHRAARSRPDPPTLLMPRVPAVRPQRARHAAPLSTDVSFCQPTPRCVCGRPREGVWCCWVCRAASDGGWDLGPWRPGIHWTAAHTWACEQRAKRYAAISLRRPR
jgi:hypothetical protein